MAHGRCALLLGTLLAAGVAGATEADDRTMQIERQTVAYTVNPDGSYVEERETAVKVIKESALEAAKDAAVSYSTSVQKAEVIAAYTLKPDGRRVDVPKGNYQVNSRGGKNGDSPVYSDSTTLSVVFPDLAPGDTTVFSYRLTALEPMFAGQFSVIDNYSPATYYGDVHVTIDAPEDLVADHQAWQMRELARPPARGRRIIEWSWQNRRPVAADTLRDTVFNVERYPGYAFSTFSSYAQIARAYGVKADAKAVPTERIRALADQIAGDAVDQREVARALYEWVSRTITYAGNCIGLGAVVPRDLDVVVDNRMGDCKDHATLLQALLTAKGIKSTQALVNAGGTYTLPRIAVASMVNHVINYVPSLDLYLDSTAATVPFGSLPTGSAGKPVLLVDGFRSDARTPTADAGKNWQHMKTSLQIAPDGSVKGTLALELGGRLAVAARDQFRDMTPSDADKLVKRYFQQSALKAEGTVHYDDPKPMLDHFKLDATFDVAQMIPLSGGIQIQPWFLSLAPVSAIVYRNLVDDDQPAGEAACSGVLSSEEYRFDFPATMRIVAMPKDFAVNNGRLSYAATYQQQQANRLIVRRTLEDRSEGPVCSAEYNTALAQSMRAILPDLRTQIVYLQQSSEP